MLIARIKLATVVLFTYFSCTACTIVSIPDGMDSSGTDELAILWHPDLKIRRIGNLPVTSPGLARSDRTLIPSGQQRIYAERSDHQPYGGVITVQIHGLAKIQPGRIYYAHQNQVRGRLEIVELPSDFQLPKSNGVFSDPAYKDAVQHAEEIHKANIFSSPTNKEK